MSSIRPSFAAAMRNRIAAWSTMLIVSLCATTLHAQPSQVSYQGELKKDGLPFTGTAHMKFVIVDGDGETIWSNDGTSAAGSEPTDFVSIATENGIFAVRLGATPMEPISGGLLKGVTEVALRVWVNTGDGFEQLTDQPISSSAFSLSGEKCLEIGDLQINVVPRWDGTALVPGALFDDGNNVGVGTNSPALKLDVSGTVRSSAGGFQFPDGTTQTTAVTGGGGGVPSGAMILTDTPESPDGYQHNGMTVTLSGTGLWHKRADMPVAIAGLFAVACQGKLYTFGGGGEGISNPNRVYEYDPSSDIWTRKADMPVTLEGFAAAELDGLILVVGGSQGPQMYATTFSYSPEFDSWSSAAPMPTARDHLMAATVNGKLYAMGGREINAGIPNQAAIDVVQEYDPALDSWIVKSPMPLLRSQGESVTVNNKILVVGGVDVTGTPTSTVQSYDPVLDAWTIGPSVPGPTRVAYGVAVSNSRLFCMGGYVSLCSPVCPSFAVNEFDADTGLWSLAPDLQIARYFFSAAEVGGKIYAVGGTSYTTGTSTTLKTTEELRPPVRFFVQHKE